MNPRFPTLHASLSRFLVLLVFCLQLIATNGAGTMFGEPVDDALLMKDMSAR